MTTPDDTWDDHPSGPPTLRGMTLQDYLRELTEPPPEISPELSVDDIFDPLCCLYCTGVVGLTCECPKDVEP